MKTLLIVYHSMTGGAEQMARAAAQGAIDQTSVQVRMLRAVEAGPRDRGRPGRRARAGVL